MFNKGFSFTSNSIWLALDAVVSDVISELLILVSTLEALRVVVPDVSAIFEPITSLSFLPEVLAVFLLITSPLMFVSEVLAVFYPSCLGWFCLKYRLCLYPSFHCFLCLTCWLHLYPSHGYCIWFA